ncbi:hypothetical protein PENSPDRAFT_753609 [Peniophora sp. CONT]|nr:hypothetical protein PENSPDRAFT_753609 [Peniophora sp. CONT]
MEPSTPSSSKPTGSFAYQQRLLERTSSGRGGTLGRSGSIASIGSTSSGPATRRWAPAHRVGGSLDMVRGKWDERVKSSEGESASPPSSPVPVSSPSQESIGRRSGDYGERAPTYLKRQSVPPPIVASPLSPNSTGVTVQDDVSGDRMHIPSRTHRANTLDTIYSQHTGSSSSSSSTLTRTDSARSNTSLTRNGSVSSAISKFESGATSTPSTSTSTSTPRQRPTSLYNKFPQPSEIRAQFEAAAPPTPTTPTPVETPKRARPISLYGSSAYAKPTDVFAQPVAPPPRAPSPERDIPPRIARHRSISPDKPPVPYVPSTSGLPSSSAMHPEPFYSARLHRPPAIVHEPPSPSTPTTPSVMTPAPYTPTPRARKPYAEHLSAGRKLGKHLPRIASGDADDDWVAPDPEPYNAGPPPPTRSRLERKLQGKLASAPAPHRAGLVAPSSAPVTGVSGRLRLSRASRADAAVLPVPSGKLRWGLWADTQRHLLQAYEYLCHVGEAQQWIEGCLGRELGFGVVEMEEGLRNGAVLAKLVRVFLGEGSVPKIWETPYPDWRHSDNINAFFVFVRDPTVGLPESFIFETTDLYNKKNLPKVIYCIHALSHLLARLGRAERIGNLLGQLKFSDDQLERTRRGLTAAGVAMPNFGAVGKSLAREMNEPEEEEEEVESEEERRDRLLLECEGSIVELQSALRGFLVRKTHSTQTAEFQLAGKYIKRLQAAARGALARRDVREARKDHKVSTPFVRALQASARGALVRRKVDVQLDRIHAHARSFVHFQAQARGYLARARYAKLKGALAHASRAVPKLQAMARARLVKRAQAAQMKVYTAPTQTRAIVGIQASARGMLMRRAVAVRLSAIDQHEDVWISLQAQLRGMLVRRRIGRQLARLDDVTDVIVRIQAFLRSYLARKRLLKLIRALRAATPVIVGVQARARAKIETRKREEMRKALGVATVAKAVGSFQARARAAIARTRHAETTKALSFAAPDVRGLQAAARGALLRREWHAWRDYIRSSEPAATALQALFRGLMQRKAFREKMEHYRANMGKVVKIQALFRAKETREQYRQLTLGTNVSVGALKSFVHLLDDSEADFAEELALERARKAVVERIRECQGLESDVAAMDVKIALVVNNAKTFEELKDAKRRYGTDSAALHAARASVLAAHGDPFAGPSTLDQQARRKLELYQQLFYILQSRGEYLGRLFRVCGEEGTGEKERRMLERVVLMLFGYGSDRREDFLLLKVLQYAVIEEVNHSSTLADVVGRGQRVWINVVLGYLRHKQAAHLRETLAPLLADMLAKPELDLEADPVVVFRARAERQEMRTGVAMDPALKNVAFTQAIADLANRGEYIRHLQALTWWTEAFVDTITQSTKRMPFAVRFLARELLAATQAKFPEAVGAHPAAVGRLVFYRYINPAVITPETYNIVTQTLDIGTRKNLAQISRVMTQISSGLPFDEQSPAYIPMNDFVTKAITRMGAWLTEVASVPDAEEHYHAHDFLDATVQPRPIYITPNEVYAMHGLLSAHLDALAPARDDPLRVILAELNGVPHLGADEQLKDARERPITLELTNRFAHIRDPRADEKALWLQAKRAVLAILRVQPGKDLVEALMQPVTDEHEALWEEVIESEMEAEPMRAGHGRLPSAVAQESAYRLEDIRQLSFREVKAHAIYFLLELEKQGKITRSDGYQGVLNAIANDVRSKHRMRLQRQQEIDGMTEALAALNERKKHYLSQLESYSEYVEQSMATMQRGKSKKRIALPFTKQFFHQRDLAKAGRTPQFGSFKYSASDLYERGVLLSVDNFSPLQFGKLDVILSSDKLGVFKVEVLNASHGGGMVSLVGAEDIKMQDLLQMRFEEKASLALYDGAAKFNLDLLLYQINKKFYV